MHSLQKVLYGGIILDFLLIGLGLVLFPTTLSASSQGWTGLAGAGFILAVYAAASIFIVPAVARKFPRSLRSGLGFGLAAGAIYAIQILIGYLIPLDEQGNASLSMVTYGAFFLLLFLAAAFTALEERSWRAGLLAALWCALVGLVIWACVLLASYYIFLSSVQEARLLEVDQTISNFHTSGMSDLRAFVMQDYLGGIFFHLVLGPLFALVFGGIGALAGRALGRPRLAP
jgi:hypothetical protein